MSNNNNVSNTNEIVKPAIALCVITIIAGLLLSIVYQVTKEPIRQQEIATINNALKEIIVDATDFTENTQDDFPFPITSLYTALNNEDIIGYVIGVEPNAYNGTLSMMVGIDVDGIVEGISIVSHAETAGLGANAQSTTFYDKFKGTFGMLSVTKNPVPMENEIVAITSATITSQGVVDGVNYCLDYFNEYLGGGK